MQVIEHILKIGSFKMYTIAFAKYGNYTFSHWKKSILGFGIQNLLLYNAPLLENLATPILVIF